MAKTAASPRPARSWGSGTSAIARLLLAVEEPLTQVAIADAVAVTQPRASQVLKQLTAQGVVRSGVRGYVATKRARLLDLYREKSRPTLVRPEEAWYGTAELLDQVHSTVGFASLARAAISVSADVGPDLLVPWRHPTIAILYTTASLDLGQARFVRAEGRGDATLLVRTTGDQSLLKPFGPWPTTVQDIPLADPVQQWRDLLDLGGDDRREAAARLRRAILGHTISVAA
jgi:hypothetical protein